MEVESRFDCSDHEMVEFKMLKERRKTYSRTKILNFRRRLRGVQVDRAPGHSPAQEHLTLHVKNKKKKRWTKIKNMKCKRSWSSSPPITAGFALAAPGRRRQAGPAERDQERKGG